MDDIKLLFSGDFAPIGRVEAACKSNQFFNSIAEIKQLTDKVDLHITNLECPLTNFSTPISKIGPSIKGIPESISLLKSLNVGLVCLANNHILDYGPIGISDTITLCKSAGIETVGAGSNNKDARKIVYKYIKGKTIAFINYCEAEFSIATDSSAGANHINAINAFYDISSAKERTSLIFVIIHGGHEEFPLPSPRIKEFVHFLSDLGVSAVIGHHPHVYSGFEIKNNSPLVYSLGNFIFDEPENTSTGWHIGALALICIDSDNRIKLEVKFIRQEKKLLKISLLNEEETIDENKKLEVLSTIIKDDAQLNEQWVKFVDRLKNGFIKQILNFSILKRVLFRLKIFNHLLFNKEVLLMQLNIIRCESHRDSLIHSILSKLKEIK